MSDTTFASLAADYSHPDADAFVTEITEAAAHADVASDEDLLAVGRRVVSYDVRSRVDERGVRLRGLHVVLRLLQRPGRLLASATKFPEAVSVLLATPDRTQDDVDRALVANHEWRSFDPNLDVTALLLADASKDAHDRAFASTAFALRRMTAIPEPHYLDALDRLEAARPAPDRTFDELPSALHSLSGAWGAGSPRSVPAKRAKRVQAVIERVDAVFSKCVARATNLEVRDAQQMTPLHQACVNLCAERARVLVAAGANPASKDATGSDAFAIARRYSPEVGAAVLAALGP